MSTASHPDSDRPTEPTSSSDCSGSANQALAAGSAELAPRVRTGGCLCDDTKYEVAGDPDDPHLCSCRYETNLSGGPAVLWVGFRRDTLRWVGSGGEPRWYRSGKVRRGFCPRCGSQLVSVADDSDMIMVTGFSLDDRSGTDPVGHSFREEAVSWMVIQLAPDPRAAQASATSA